jgi:hypothetical protein
MSLLVLLLQLSLLVLLFTNEPLLVLLFTNEPLLVLLFKGESASPLTQLVLLLTCESPTRTGLNFFLAHR